jgi:hypothetical protein
MSFVELYCNLTELYQAKLINIGSPTHNNLTLINILMKKGLIGLVIIGGFVACNNTKPTIKE